MELKLCYLSAADTQARKTKTHLGVTILHSYKWTARLFYVDTLR